MIEPIKKKKVVSLGKLKKKVWALCSKYIRLKYADEYGREKCTTCNEVKHWKEMQAGHFAPGRNNAILFDHRGIHPQCYACNICKHGNLIEYYDFMLKTYGQEIVDDLKRLQHTSKQFTLQELLDLEEFYKREIKEMESKLPCG
jgi:hypothetical protein